MRTSASHVRSSPGVASLAAWADVLTAEDKRGLTALFWAHVRPYGDITLNMTNRLAISETPPTETDETA